MAQTTTVIFILATLLVATTVVSGQTPPSPVAPSPTINEAMNCAAGLTVCLPAFAQGGTSPKECCTALETAVKTQQSCLSISLPSVLLSPSPVGSIPISTCVQKLPVKCCL
ncbi:hypothetical protein F2Q70_00017039 [Brassica cretica]|uniref:Bifunctional inhibitor/plant lipid transfer protein/seed storage helical domain-containing protein n=1 Tax=Brassica cretica TaxID=69181 RepID=A0A8S9I349_BRACR|nr:hypothetical protein F2Q70_00017039 [Brassica cretica]KAF2599668.1 hypothetical protein F2Q68_00009988 [Brassica cretica]